MEFETTVLSKFRVLSVDCEARPLSWLSQDFVTKEMTAIAAKFLDSDKIYCWYLGKNSQEEMLENFLKIYEKAGLVTGHFLRGYDLPLINAMLLEFGYPPLCSKMTHDTYLDLVNCQGVSKSQESLADMLGVEAPKIQMRQIHWRSANRLQAPGIKRAIDRVTGDVVQQHEVRAKLIERNWIRPMKLWKGKK